jgi:zinc D-Ala-D-Ala carboxypeptidase
MTDKLFGHKTDIADIYGFEKYSVDLELLRTNPELSTRRLLTTVTDIIGTTTHYKSYGMVMDVVDTTKPQTIINQYLKDNTTVTAGSFKEYRVQLFDRNPVRLKTVMQNCNDVLRGITLKVCSVSSQLDASVLQPGMLVLVDYTDSTGRDGTIVEVLGNLPSVVSEDTTEYDAKVPFQSEPCPDTSNVKPSSDPVNSPNTGDIERLKYAKVIESGDGFLIVELSDGTRVKKEGNLAKRNNNPGNIRSDSTQIGQSHGKTGVFSVFATYEDGLAALNKLLFNPAGKYYNLSIEAAINKYAPPKENNTERYIIQLSQGINKPRTFLIKDLTDAERVRFTDTIAKLEGYNDNGYKTTIIQGTTSAPTPTFNSPSCKLPQESIEDAQPSNPDSQFSKYFTLKDLTKTRRAIANIPNEDEKSRLGFLARDVLDPLVDKYGKDSFTINSAFRSEAVNKSVGGNANSQHRWGQAVDITFTKLSKDEDIFDRFEEIVASNIPYDQIIFESDATGVIWFHISIASSDGISPFDKRKKEVLMHGPWTASKSSKGAYPKYQRAGLDIRVKTTGRTEKV